MKVTRKIVEEFYKVPDERFFIDRNARNAYYSNKTIEPGELCAVQVDITKDTLDENTEFYVESFNGSNWSLMSIDEDFALVVTNEGLRALTNAEEGKYELKVSRVAIRSESASTSANLTTWNETYFTYNSKTSQGARNLLVLDTKGSDNSTFTLEHNLSYRYNMANGGIQYTILLDSETIGLDYANPIISGGVTSYAQLPEFNIGMIGLFVLDPSSPGKDVLLAVGSLSTPIKKYCTTAARVGNSIKLYLNTTLSNLGYVSDLTTLMESTTSIPEVPTEAYLANTWYGTSVPHNIYLVDDLNGSGIPALAVRQGDPAVNENIEWTYFSPNSANITINRETDCSSDVKDYMVVAFDSNDSQYVPADGKNSSLKTQGVIVGNTILYNNTVTNKSKKWRYYLQLANAGAQHYAGRGYAIGDILKFTMGTGTESINYSIKVTDIEQGDNNALKSFTYTPLSSDYPSSGAGYEGSDISPIVVTGNGSGALFNLTASNADLSSITWRFPNTWINKPLFVDYDHSSETTEEWEQYLRDCDLVGVADPNQRDRRGYLTIKEIPDADFVGWCKDNDIVQLALDLRIEATYDEYGTTRYAKVADIKNAKNSNVSNRTSVTPKMLQDNYLQITQPDSDAGGAGTSVTNPIIVKTHTKFEHAIVGAGYSTNVNQDSNVSFYGKSYRALWADLAEYYRSDKLYPAGTLICVGDGMHSEISLAKVECNGIISTNPGYTLGDKKNEYDLPVALIGKVPVLFAKDCDLEFGNRIYLSKTEPGKASTIPNGKCLGKIIDRSEDLNTKPSVLCSVKLTF